MRIALVAGAAVLVLAGCSASTETTEESALTACTEVIEAEYVDLEQHPVTYSDEKVTITDGVAHVQMRSRGTGSQLATMAANCTVDDGVATLEEFESVKTPSASTKYAGIQPGSDREQFVDYLLEQVGTTVGELPVTPAQIAQSGADACRDYKDGGTMNSVSAMLERQGYTRMSAAYIVRATRATLCADAWPFT